MPVSNGVNLSARVPGWDPMWNALTPKGRKTCQSEIHSVDGTCWEYAIVTVTVRRRTGTRVVQNYVWFWNESKYCFQTELIVVSLQILRAPKLNVVLLWVAAARGSSSGLWGVSKGFPFWTIPIEPMNLSASLVWASSGHCQDRGQHVFFSLVGLPLTGSGLRRQGDDHNRIFSCGAFTAWEWFGFVKFRGTEF